MSPIKEPNFFSRSLHQKLYASKPFREEQDFLKLFENVTNETAIGEATANYLWDPKAPFLIKEKIPNAKIIMILRDPVERAFSDYLFSKSLGLETSSFHEAIRKALKSKPDFSGRIIDAGLYYEQVKRYYENFNKNQIKILIFEEFSKNTINAVKEVLQFLDIKSELPENLDRIYNPQSFPQNKLILELVKNPLVRKFASKVVSRSTSVKLKKKLYKEIPKPKFPEEERKFLEDIFRDDVKKLEELIGRKLHWSVSPKNQ